MLIGTRFTGRRQDIATLEGLRRAAGLPAKTLRESMQHTLIGITDNTNVETEMVQQVKEAKLVAMSIRGNYGFIGIYMSNR